MGIRLYGNRLNHLHNWLKNNHITNLSSFFLTHIKMLCPNFNRGLFWIVGLFLSASFCRNHRHFKVLGREVKLFGASTPSYRGTFSFMHNRVTQSKATASQRQDSAKLSQNQVAQPVPGLLSPGHQQATLCPLYLQSPHIPNKETLANQCFCQR